jgi:hypothetical protein
LEGAIYILIPKDLLYLRTGIQGLVHLNDYILVLMW